MRFLDKSTRSRIRKVIEDKYPEGPMREAEMFRWLCGRKAIPRRHDFIERLVKVQHKLTGEIVPFVLNKPQRTVEAHRIRCERANKPIRMAILKARQWGISTFMVAAGLEFIARGEYMKACILADDEDLARTLLETGKLMKENLPYELPTKYANRSQLFIDKPWNSNLDIASAKTDSPCRGKTYRWLHATEPGTWDKPQTKVASVNQAIPNMPGTSLSYEGTARGVGNWWHQFWWDAFHGKNDYHAFFFPWFYDPDFDYAHPFERDEEKLALLSDLDDEEKYLLKIGATTEGLKWRRYHIRNNFFGDIDQFHQEFPATAEEAWLASGRPVFPRSHVIRVRAECEDPIFRGDILVDRFNEDKKEFDYRVIPNPRGAWTVWEEPNQASTYVMGADTGEGIDGGDFSVVYVMDKATMNVVAEWWGHISPNDWGDMLFCIGQHYLWGYILPEVENQGAATVARLKERCYRNLGLRPVFDTPGKRVHTKWGWSTNVKTKYIAINEARDVISMIEERPKLNSQRLCQEMMEYEIADDGKYTAPSGRHDDCVMAWAVTLMARKDTAMRQVHEPEPLPPKTLDEEHWREYEASISESDDDYDY